MRRLYLSIICLISILGIKASPVIFSKSIPDNNSRISSFEFVLEFDISGAIEELGEGDWGLGYSGSTRATSKLKTTLYEGEPEGEKTEIAKALTSNLFGNMSGFEAGNNKVCISFSSSLKPEVGKKYFLEIGNNFGLFKTGDKTMNSATMLSYSTTPLIISFIGGEPTANELVLLEASVQDNEELDFIKSIAYTFNESVKLTEFAKLQIIDDVSTISETSIASYSNDDKTITFEFPENVELWEGHTYKISLLPNSVSLESDTSVTNKEILIEVKGSNTTKCEITSTTPNNGAKGIFDDVVINYDIPQGYTLTLPRGTIVTNAAATLYVNEVSEENILKSYGPYTTSITSDGNGQMWDLSDIVIVPETKYIFSIPANQIRVYKDGVACPEYGNEEYIFSWTTPSIEEADVKQPTYSTPVIGQHDKSNEILKGGERYETIGHLEMAFEGLKYQYGDRRLNMAYNFSKQTAKLYAVVDGEDVLIKEALTGTTQRESTYENYSVFVMDFANSILFEGITYKIVIPAGTIAASHNHLIQYTKNPEMVWTIYGATPTKVEVLDCTYKDGDEESSLSSVVWELQGTFDLADDAKGYMFVNNMYDNEPLSILNNGGKTYVTLSCLAPYTGKPTQLSVGKEYKLIIPEGTIYYAGDPSIKNEELSVIIIGKAEESNNPEFVNTTVTLADEETNEAHSFIVETVKGYPAKIQMLPGENWNVADVAHEGKSLSAVNGVYTSEPLTADSKIVATLAFNKDMQFDQTTGVYSVTDTNIKVYTENNQIVVSGFSQPTNIAVYSVGGILVKQMTTDAKYDMVRISAEPNEIYVVVINGQAAKVRL